MSFSWLEDHPGATCLATVESHEIAESKFGAWESSVCSKVEGVWTRTRLNIRSD